MYTASYPEGLPLRDSVYGELKRGLLIGEFASRVRLGEERLAERFGVSRTPVREALLRLHTEGIVARHPEGGYCAVAPDIPGMQHLYEVRIALELDALERPGRLGTTHDAAMLEALRDDWRAMGAEALATDPDFVLVDESFHTTLADAAGNPALVEMLHLVNERVRIVRMQDFLLPGRIDVTVEQHLGIVDALLDGDVGAARERFRGHVGESYENVADQVVRALTRMASEPREQR